MRRIYRNSANITFMSVKTCDEFHYYKQKDREREAAPKKRGEVKNLASDGRVLVLLIISDGAIR